MIAQDLLLSKEHATTQTYRGEWGGALFHESELTDISWQPWYGGLGALLRSGNEDLPGNTLVLALRGVTAFSYGVGSLRETAHAMVVDRASTVSGPNSLTIDLSFYGNPDALSVTAAKAVLFSVDMAGQELPPLDYGDSPVAQVLATQPSWHSSVMVREVVGLR